MEVRALASGSSGNAYLVRESDTVLLVEAGLPARRLEQLLDGQSIDPRSVAGMLLTHAHTDHALGARAFSDRFRVPIFASAGTLGHALLRTGLFRRPLTAGAAIRLGDLEVGSFRVPHDCEEPLGFRISGARSSVGLTTDLGLVPDEALPWLRENDLLVLEANHDLEMLWSGPYPAHLKRRVAGALGHLSNTAAGECLLRLGAGAPREVWLAHLSLVNNTASTAVETIRRQISPAGLGTLPLRPLARNRPSLRWRDDPPPRQLGLFDDLDAPHRERPAETAVARW
ncbi:MAG: MBL fold metallo-hydrolase [Chloroflexi bacterium]|nr:MBL fold metallo-hydrolase [Chloroflexota bacterium]